jgi:hypothetical protein
MTDLHIIAFSLLATAIFAGLLALVERVRG